MNHDPVAVKGDAAVGTASRSVADQQNRPAVKIVIFDRWCKGCGICSALCPTQAIEADAEGRPTAAHPERCTNCRSCVIHCPDLAISVTSLKSEEGR